MFEIFGGIQHLLKFEQVCIDNNVFRLHYKATMLLLLALCIISTSRQYLGEPIDCVVEGMPEHTMNNYCWITSTFTLPRKFGQIGIDLPHQGVSSFVPGVDEVKHQKYYQWVCFYLFFQAVLFYIPRYLWKIWEGGKAKALANDLKLISLDHDQMEKKCRFLCDYFDKNMSYHSLYFYRFVFCELLNLVNVIGQMFLIDWYLDHEFSTYGWDVLNYIHMDQDERMDPMSELFPKMAKCTFYKYGPSGSVESRDGLCVLAINVFNEKVYVFLWFWFIVLAVITGLAVLYRLLTIVSLQLRYLLLKSKFRIASKRDVQYLSYNMSVGDWFIFNQIGQNVDPFAFKIVITNLANIMRNKESIVDEKKQLYEIGFKIDV